ncbi:hypothetical protein PVT71_28645 (plasmid) [Salipiger sp. H15]|uniref:Uncharacterized protein n=1 Tax=Alloyangia sp. H15 TaxID=3029062 RepID=A0AAU8ASF7_9RHOB
MSHSSSLSRTTRAPARPVSPDMQTVLDQTPDESARRCIARLSEYVGAPLCTLDGAGGDLLAWFDTHFPPLTHIGAGPLPGAPRAFWRSHRAYAHWRAVLRCRIHVTLGLAAAKQPRRARIDTRTPLHDLLIKRSKEGLRGMPQCLQPYLTSRAKPASPASSFPSPRLTPPEGRWPSRPPAPARFPARRST